MYLISEPIKNGSAFIVLNRPTHFIDNHLFYFFSHTGSRRYLIPLIVSSAGSPKGKVSEFKVSDSKFDFMNRTTCSVPKASFAPNYKSVAIVIINDGTFAAKFDRFITSWVWYSHTGYWGGLLRMGFDFRGRLLLRAKVPHRVLVLFGRGRLLQSVWAISFSR